MNYFLFYTVLIPGNGNGIQDRIADRMFNFGEVGDDQISNKKLKAFMAEEEYTCNCLGRKFIFGTFIKVDKGKVIEIEQPKE